jgi:hypothetical protein
MAGPSKTKRNKAGKTKRNKAGRPEEQKRLHEAVDRILDGPGDSDPDLWVRRVLVDIGFVIRAFAPALDYEVGRIVSRVDRPHGHFPSNISWQGAGLNVTSQQASQWIAAGAAARGNWPSSEIQQQALAALFRPIASISCHSWLDHLAEALDKLRFGEVRPPLERSNRGLWGIGEGMTEWQQRLAALRWVEFLVGARKMDTKAAAYRSIATELGVPIHTMKDWPRAAAKLFGRAAIREELELARRVGEHVHQINGQIASGEASERDRSYCIQKEAAYSQELLKELAKRFKARPRKRHKVGK